MRHIKAKIISNERLAPGRFRMRLEAPSICREARPGQFVMVKCSKDLRPFLRRPLSFHRIRERYFELLYQVIGKGTKELSRRKRGENLDVIGPLGNGFNLKPPLARDKKALSSQRLLIAGGIGVAPLLALAEELSRRKARFAVLVGGRTKSHILCIDELKKLGAKIEVATEDGSKGHRGLTTDLLKRIIQGKRREAYSEIYVCGPNGMLREVTKIAKSGRLPCQVSFEEKMGCGTGACLGCAVKTVTGYKMACKDGPIFNSGDIIW